MESQVSGNTAFRRIDRSVGRAAVSTHSKHLAIRIQNSEFSTQHIDKKYFHASEKPLYLTAMAVHPDYQRKGIGRSSIDEARRLAIAWPGDAIRLDAYDTAAGAGDFYRKCGFREVGRAVYRVAPLIYFEMLL
jgi:ribosomal protein S18 acetylase RimI-like enzyme